MIVVHKLDWHLILYAALWEYQTFVRTTTKFTPFQLVYCIEAILPNECEIPSLKLVVELLPASSTEQECLLHLTHLDETQRDASMANKAHKKRIKAQYDKSFKPSVFSEGDIILLYDQESNKLGSGKFKPMWLVPYIFKCVLAKGAYQLIDFDGFPWHSPEIGCTLINIMLEFCVVHYVHTIYRCDRVCL